MGGPRIYVVRTFAAPLLRRDRREANADEESEKERVGERASEGKGGEGEVEEKVA